MKTQGVLQEGSEILGALYLKKKILFLYFVRYQGNDQYFIY